MSSGISWDGPLEIIHMRLPNGGFESGMINTATGARAVYTMSGNHQGPPVGPYPDPFVPISGGDTGGNPAADSIDVQAEDFA